MCSSSSSSSSSASSIDDCHPTHSGIIRQPIGGGGLCEPSPSTSSGSSSPATSELATYPLIPREQLQVQQQLGVGTYGSVFKGIWERSDVFPLPVALKKVFMLEKEVQILSQIRHRNIIQFYGVSQANPDFFIVTEYAENCSLYEHLHNKEEQISLERTIKWAMQIARGVAYLHHEAPITVIHRDLKSKNVVIGKKFQCKLCDFGTSKDLTHSWTAPSWGGTAAWMSPEIISQREGITTATDVWSFGVVLWEMFSRQVPYKGLTEFKIYTIISQHGVRLVIPSTCPEPLAQLLESCWSLNTKERPDMRYVLAILERMSRDKCLREECAQFLDEGKEEWRQRIQEQLGQLDTLKLDLARQMEDLCRREQALRKRESSHRNFLHMVDILNVENVCEWNEDCVCEWVQNIAAAAVADFTDESVDKIISSVLQYSINGPRLLKITEKDLDSLGIEPIALRRYIMLKLDELRALCNVQLCNFPGSPSSSGVITTPPSSQQLDGPPIQCPIVLHVGLYSRSVRDSMARFKVFLDSDWEMATAAGGGGGGDGDGKSANITPEELQDSATVIKEVNISMSAADGSSLLGPVQCICPPFGYLEWAQLSRDEQQRKLPLTISLLIAYTDQVIQPRNTRIQIKLDDLAGGPRTLCCKRVPLKLCPTPTDTSLSRLSTSLQRNSLKSPPACAVANFRSRRRSFGLNESISPHRRGQPPPIGGSTSNLLNRSPVWADLAANIRNSTFPTFRPVSRSITSSGTSSGLHRSTSSEQDAAKLLEGEGEPVAGPMDPVAAARQRALARVRQRVERKKCRSETEPDKQQQQKLAQSIGGSVHFIMDTSSSSPSGASGTTPSSNSPNSSASPTNSSSSTPNAVVQKEEAEEQPKAKCGLLASREEKKQGGGGLKRLIVPAPENLMKMTEKAEKISQKAAHFGQPQCVCNQR